MFIDLTASQNLARSSVCFSYSCEQLPLSFDFWKSAECCLLWGRWDVIRSMWSSGDMTQYSATGRLLEFTVLLSRFCWSEWRNSLCLKFMVPLASWHRAVLLGIHPASKPGRSHFPYHMYTKSTVNCISIFISYHLMQDKFVEINTQSVRQHLDFHLAYCWMWQLHSPPNRLCWKWADRSDQFSGNFEQF